MRDYKSLIKELKENGTNPLSGDFYEYEDISLEQESSEFYKYCQEYLDRDDLGFKIAPARRQDQTVSANERSAGF